MRIGIFGGSFNPPHVGHLVIAEWMREEFGLDRIVWVPAARSPFKVEADLVEPSHRLEMVRCAVQGNPAFDVSDVEIRRGGTSYTVDTLRQLTARHPNDRLFLLMGSDSLAGFPEWREPEEILAMAGLLVFRRPNVEDPPLPEHFREHVRYADAPLLAISATDVRERCAARKSVRYLVPDAVRVYIQSHDLYTGG